MESISTSEVNLFLERKEGFKLDCSVKFPTEGITVVFGESGSGRMTRRISFYRLGSASWVMYFKNLLFFLIFPR